MSRREKGLHGLCDGDEMLDTEKVFLCLIRFDCLPGLLHGYAFIIPLKTERSEVAIDYTLQSLRFA